MISGEADTGDGYFCSVEQAQHESVLLSQLSDALYSPLVVHQPANQCMPPVGEGCDGEDFVAASSDEAVISDNGVRVDFGISTCTGTGTGAVDSAVGATVLLLTGSPQLSGTHLNHAVLLFSILFTHRYILCYNEVDIYIYIFIYIRPQL